MYNGCEKVLKQQNTMFVIKISPAKIPEVTLMLILILDEGKVTASIVPKVSNKLIPLTMVTSKRISSMRHQVYIPKTIKAHTAIAIMLGIIFSFIIVAI